MTTTDGISRIENRPAGSLVAHFDTPARRSPRASRRCPITICCCRSSTTRVRAATVAHPAWPEGPVDPTMRLDNWDSTAKVTFDHALLNELATLRFLDAHAHVTIVGPVGVGQTFLAHALGHIACRRGATVFAARTDRMLKTLKHARLDNSYEAELRKLVAVDLLILDDFAIDVLDPVESRDLYDLLLERYRIGSVVVTSNRGPDEWLATFADPVRAQSAIDRFTSNAYDLVIEGESYRPRLKPRLAKEGKERSR